MEYIDEVIDRLRAAGIRAQRDGADWSPTGGSSRYIELWVSGERNVWHMLSPSLDALIEDPRIDGYNPEFFGAKPAKVGEDY